MWLTGTHPGGGASRCDSRFEKFESKFKFTDAIDARMGT